MVWSRVLAVVRKDVAAAQKQYDNLQRGGTIVPIFLANERVLGLLAETMAAPDEAVQHFEDALAFCRKGYRPELAWTCCDYADTLLRRDGPGDREKASALLDESLAVSTELNMRPLMERVTARQRDSASRPGVPTTYPDGLTQREVELLRLIALGKNNREIAEELAISLRTVAHHVTSILRKTGAANRTEAAGYAARQGLVSW